MVDSEVILEVIENQHSGIFINFVEQKKHHKIYIYYSLYPIDL